MQKETPYKVSLIYNNANEIDYQLKCFDVYIKENNFFKHINNREEILKLIISIYSELQDIHPFREGNTRTIKIFLNEFAKQFGYRFDFNEMTDSESMLIKFLLKPANESETKIIELFNDAKNILSKYLFEYDPTKVDIFVKRPKDEDLYSKYKDKLYKLKHDSKSKSLNEHDRNIIRNYYKHK
jgi:fido (protein-threonine AMPylation protein)